MASTVLSQIPVVGDLCSLLLNIFWPSPRNWVAIKERKLGTRIYGHTVKNRVSLL